MLYKGGGGGGIAAIKGVKITSLLLTQWVSETCMLGVSFPHSWMELYTFWVNVLGKHKSNFERSHMDSLLLAATLTFTNFTMNAAYSLFCYSRWLSQHVAVRWCRMKRLTNWLTQVTLSVVCAGAIHRWSVLLKAPEHMMSCAETT